MTDRDLLKLAIKHLEGEDLRVWLAKNAQGYGRRAGSLMLGITEDAWRYRLDRANRRLDPHIHAAKENAA